VSRIRQDAYRTRYLDATEFIRHTARPGELIMGSTELGWEPRFSDLDAIVGTAWGWHRSHPRGYSPT
jgi:UDP-glucose 4-epimerase